VAAGPLVTRVAAPLLIVVACVAVYANSLHHPFVFDDERAIVENRSIRQLSSMDEVLRPPEHSPVTGRPLANLSFAINFALGGLDTRGYHVVNITVHALAALMLFCVLRRTFRRPGSMPFAADVGRADIVALLCTLVWALHPLVSEVINYVTQRTESLMGLFYLLSLYCAIRAVDAHRAGRWEIASAVAALCAVASKETALTLPVLIPLWDRIFAFPSVRAAWAVRRRLYGLVALSWLLFLVLGRSADSGMGGMSMSGWTYLLNQAPMVVQYLKLSLWLTLLIFDYGVAQPLTVLDVWPSLLAVSTLVLAACAALRWAPAAGFWSAWFFITLAPMTSVVAIPVEVGAERRMYLPLVGLVVLAVTGTGGLLRRYVTPPSVRRLEWLTAAVVIGALGTVTVRRNAEYRTGISIWQTVVDRRPHWRAHEHLSVHLRDAGRMDESIAHLRIAAAGSPNSQHALAAALLAHGDTAEAISQFRDFIRKWPGDSEIALARRELAAALMKSGDKPGAIDELRTVAANSPTDVRSRIALAEALESAHYPDAAEESYRVALRLQPDNVVALARLGVALASTGRGDEALPLLLRALELEPRASGVSCVWSRCSSPATR
jgi:protein O-mannosyl-transferase